jgi:hypothetical protein
MPQMRGKELVLRRSTTVSYDGKNMSMNIPLSQDETRNAYFTLPKDLTHEEATRIGIIIKALVMEPQQIRQEDFPLKTPGMAPWRPAGQEDFLS